MQPEQTPPQTFGPEQPAQPPKKGLNKKLLIIIGAAVLVVLAIIGVTLMLSKSKTDDKSAKKSAITADDKMYHFRDGYDINEYGARIGDPQALNITKTSDVVKSGTGVPIVYACGLLTLADMSTQKVYAQANWAEKAWQRNFLDRTGKAPVEVSQYTLPSTDESNECILGTEPSGIVIIDVYQPPYVTTGAVDDQLNRNYNKIDSINGLQTYKDKKSNKGSYDYMIRSGNDAVQIHFASDKIDEAKSKSLLTTAAKNFVSHQQSPQGYAMPTYDTPTYKKVYARACDFISNDDIKGLTGSDASIYSHEGWGTATGISDVNGQLYNSVQTSCSRFNTGLGSGLTAGAFDQKLEVTITSFNDAAPAKDYISNMIHDAKEKGTIAAGDEGYGYRDTASQNTVIVRQGRFVAEVMFDRTAQRNAGLQETAAMAQKLTPFSQQVAAKLKTMQ